MNNFRKIHIIGGAGSGKTYTSIKLAQITKTNPIELDGLFWDKTDKYYNRKSYSKHRDMELYELISHDSWILEGIYYEWLSESFKKADLIIFLRSNFMLCTFRIILRFIKEKVGIIHPPKKETFNGLISIIMRNRIYHKVHIPAIIRHLSPYSYKLKFFEKGDDVIEYFSTMK